MKKQGLQGAAATGVLAPGSDDSSSAVVPPACGNIVWLRDVAVDKRWESVASYRPVSSHCGGGGGSGR